MRIEKGDGSLDRGEIKMRLMEYAAKGYEVPRMDMIKTPEQIAGIREAGRLNTEVRTKSIRLSTIIRWTMAAFRPA